MEAITYNTVTCTGPLQGDLIKIKIDRHIESCVFALEKIGFGITVEKAKELFESLYTRVDLTEPELYELLYVRIQNLSVTLTDIEKLIVALDMMNLWKVHCGPREEIDALEVFVECYTGFIRDNSPDFVYNKNDVKLYFDEHLSTHEMSYVDDIDHPRDTRYIY